MEKQTEEEQTKADEIAEEVGSWADTDAIEAYISIVGEEYATTEGFQDSYAGQFSSDEDFAEDLADQLGLVDANASWPNNCIDWTDAAREIMYDYAEENGYYFRNL